MADTTTSSQADHPDRRQFLASSAVATGAMAGGLALGYGMFVRCAGQYLYPAEEGTAWMFVTDAASIAPGHAFSFVSPTGVAVVITRKSSEQRVGSKEHGAGQLAEVEQGSSQDTQADGPGADAEPKSGEFLALSSVCPHLGCRVHWEPQNDRFFCPCHLGTFDPEGRPTGGPPLAANQSLPEYPLRVENGLLYINMPVKPIDQATYRVAGTAGSEEQGAGSESANSVLPAPCSKLDPGGLA